MFALQLDDDVARANAERHVERHFQLRKMRIWMEVGRCDRFSYVLRELVSKALIYESGDIAADIENKTDSEYVCVMREIPSNH